MTRTYFGPGCKKIERGPDPVMDALVSWMGLSSTAPRKNGTIRDTYAWVQKNLPRSSRQFETYTERDRYVWRDKWSLRP